MNPTGTGLIFSSVFGGSGNDDIFSIALDSSGAVLFTGSTLSVDWPLTQKALRTKYGGGMAGKLSPDGSSLIYSTFLSGSGNSIMLDAHGNALLIGDTLQIDLVTTPNAATPCGSSSLTVQSPFVMELDPTGAEVYSSYLPTFYADALSTAGNVYFAGQDAIFDILNVFAEPAPGIRCITNAANYRNTAVAPGEIVSIFGPGIGPSQPSGAVLDASGM